VWTHEIRISREEFLQAYSVFSSVVERKTTTPFGNFLLDAPEIQLIYVRRTWSSPVGHAGEETYMGCHYLAARQTFDIVRELPGRAMPISAQRAHWAELTGRRSYFRIPGLQEKNFPRFHPLKR